MGSTARRGQLKSPQRRHRELTTQNMRPHETRPVQPTPASSPCPVPQSRSSSEKTQCTSIQTVTETWDFTGMMKGMPGNCWTPQATARGGSGHGRSDDSRKGETRYAFEEGGFGFQRMMRGLWENEEGGVISADGHPAKSVSMGRTSYGASEDTYHGSHPASAVY